MEKLCLRVPHMLFKRNLNQNIYMRLIIICCLQFKITHPDSEDLVFLYGTILTDGKDSYSEEPTTNICVFADEQVLKLIFRHKIQAIWNSNPVNMLIFIYAETG